MSLWCRLFGSSDAEASPSLGNTLLLMRADAAFVSPARLEALMPEAHEGESHPYLLLPGGIAVIAACGVLSKYPSFWRAFGLSDQPTLPELSAATRHAATSEDVRGVLVFLDSPGGTAAGTLEFAQAIAAIAAQKPTFAYAQDQACSAAYFVGSQASRLTCNAMGHVGSIGTALIVEDSSEAAKAAGVKVHVLSTGTHKGVGAPGVPITDEQLAALQENVEQINALFLAAVSAGRGIPADRVAELADGRVYVGAAALALGLVDAVETLDECLAALRAAIDSPPEARSAKPGDDHLTPPAEPEEEEYLMSDKTKPEASGATQAGADDEKGRFRAWFAEFFGVATQAAPQPAAEAPDLKALVAAEVQSLLAGQRQESNAQRLAADLAKLDGKATPGLIATMRPVLERALAGGRMDDYAASLAALAGQDASALLGGPIATEEKTGASYTGLSVSGADVAWLQARGVNPGDVARIEGKYGRLNDPSRVKVN